MVRASTNPAEALLDQSRTVLGWLQELSEDDIDRPSVLAGWDVRTLIGHLVFMNLGIARVLSRPTASAPVPLYEYVRRYRPNADQIDAAARAASADRSGAVVTAELAAAVEVVAGRLLGGEVLPQVVEGPRGACSVADFVASRVVEIVVHADDLSRSVPDRVPIPLNRRALSVCSRGLASILAGQHPGRSIEVRIPPYAAVQCGIGDPGPTHTRGTPPNVVETDALTFLRMATGRTSWDASMRTGKVAASGLRADLSAALPLLS